jgi:hypothetical protein
MLTSGAALAQEFEKDAKPFFAAFCNDCHRPGKAKGDLDLTTLAAEPKAPDAAKHWEAVIERVRAGDMPPEKSKQPGIGERDRMLKAVRPLIKEELDCSKLATDATVKFYRGHVMSRRLNRLEYNNTVRDLLGGLDARPGTDLPVDGAGGEGFDTDGSALFTSAIHVEKYLDAAGRAWHRCLMRKTLPPRSSRPRKSRPPARSSSSPPRTTRPRRARRPGGWSPSSPAGRSAGRSSRRRSTATSPCSTRRTTAATASSRP